MLVIVDEIKYLIDTFRERGSFTGTTKPEDLPCDVVFNCNPCDNVLSVGTNTWYNKAPYFYFGTKEEILRRLSDKENTLKRSEQLKYPAIFLEMPFVENGFSDNPEVDLSIIFANITDANWTYTQRYENNLIPIVYPLIEQFIKAVKQANTVAAYEFTEKIDAPFYANANVIANDFLDLALIKANLTFIKNCKKNNLCQ